MRRYFLLIFTILFLLLGFVTVPVNAEPPNYGLLPSAPDFPPPIDESQDEEDEASLWNPIRPIIELGVKVTELITTIQNFVTGKALILMLEKWIVSLLAGALGFFIIGRNNYLTTPEIGEYTFGLWSKTFWISVSFLGLAIMIAAYRIVKSEDKKETTQLLKVLIISLFLSYISLSLVNQSIKIQNYFLEIAAKNDLTQISQAYELGNEITLKDIDMATTLNLMLSDSVPEPNSGSYDFMLSTSLGVIYYSKGLVMAVIVFFLELFLIIIDDLRILAIVGLAGFAPLWIAYAALMGKIETMIGWTNLYLRTLLLGVVFTVSWLIMVKVYEGNESGKGISVLLGVDPLIINLLILIFVIVISWLAWVKHLFIASFRPLTLNGGSVLEKAGNWGESLSNGLGRLGTRLGFKPETSARIDRMKRMSKRMSETGASWQKKGENLQQSQKNWEEIAKKSTFKRIFSGPTVTSGPSHKSGNPSDISYFECAEDQVVRREENSLSLPSGTYNIFRVKYGIHEVIGKLEQYNHSNPDVTVPFTIQSGMLQIYSAKGQQSKVVNKMLHDTFQDKIPYWTGKQGYIVVQDGLPTVLSEPPYNGVQMGKWRG